VPAPSWDYLSSVRAGRARRERAGGLKEGQILDQTGDKQAVIPGYAGDWRVAAAGREFHWISGPHDGTFMREYMAQNVASDIACNGLLLIADTRAELEAEVKDYDRVSSGMQPLRPSTTNDRGKAVHSDEWNARSAGGKPLRLRPNRKRAFCGGNPGCWNPLRRIPRRRMQKTGLRQQPRVRTCATDAWHRGLVDLGFCGVGDSVRGMLTANTVKNWRRFEGSASIGTEVSSKVWKGAG
jgi:hypothetical protein